MKAAESRTKKNKRLAINEPEEKLTLNLKMDFLRKGNGNGGGKAQLKKNINFQQSKQDSPTKVNNTKIDNII